MWSVVGPAFHDMRGVLLQNVQRICFRRVNKLADKPRASSSSGTVPTPVGLPLSEKGELR
ncbi:hypothetical protein BDR04DRAFT_1100618 [Suillus decipiens]|nr:hypothetical protein BDR04DRAFT_1100618 [Suillus decipiens]